MITWYLDSGEGTAKNEVLRSRKGPPPFSPSGALAPPSTSILHSDPYFVRGRSPCYSNAAPTPLGQPPLLQTVRTHVRFQQISPPILPQFHRCIGWLGPTTSTSDHRLLDNAEILWNCLQAASDRYISYSYYFNNVFPCQVMQSETNCTHPSSSFTSDHCRPPAITFSAPKHRR